MDITRVINEIQSSNLDTDIVSMVCKAVQEYYQKLEAVGAIKPKAKPKAPKPGKVIVPKEAKKKDIEVKEPIKL